VDGTRYRDNECDSRSTLKKQSKEERSSSRGVSLVVHVVCAQANGGEDGSFGTPVDGLKPRDQRRKRLD